MKQASLLKWNKGGLKHPMARARGLGAGGGAVHHWVMQRITSVFAVPLTFWLCSAIAGHVHADYATFTAWLAQPMNAILMILSVLTFTYHAAQGLQVVYEDYLHNEALKVFKLVAMKLVMVGLAVACVFAVLKIAL